MSTDALGRRLRFAPANPEVRPKGAPKNAVLREADFVLFEAINRHGPLPTHYLFELTKEHRTSFAYFKARLTWLYNGDENGPYLKRPPQQYDSYQARYQHLVYDLAERAKVALAERGRLARYSPRRTEHFLHQLMQASVGASLEVLCRDAGLRYIPRESILTHERCPEATRTQANPLAMPVYGLTNQKAITPDDLFGIEYPGQGFRFFAMEIDRNTESIERKDPGQNAFGKKLLGYLDILKRGTYRSHFGLPNMHVLTVTTNANHKLNLIDYLRRQDCPDLHRFFAFQHEPSFGAHWRVPKTVLFPLLNEPWNSTVGTKLLDRP